MSSTSTHLVMFGFDIRATTKQHNMSSYTTTPDTTVTFDPEGKVTNIINDANIFVLRLIFFVICSIVYGIFGTVTNIINIIVFIKQGLFSGGSTLNLFFLALADLGVSVFLILYGLAYSIVVADIPNLPIHPIALVFFVFAWPLTMFTALNRFLTAYVAFERCMCVVIPFKVKNIFSPRRALIYLIIIFAYGVFSHTPIYIVHYLTESTVEGTNTTQLNIVFGEDRELWNDVVYYGNYFVLSLLTAVIVMICTVITSAYVRTSKDWRKKASGAASDSKTGTDLEGSKNEKGDKRISKSAVDKETRLVKMIMTISVIFCICYIPEMATLIVRSVDPRIDTRNEFKRLAHLIYTLKFHAASVNSGINIFVYYRMSTKYRQIFLSYFCGHKD